jgi:hypothetical protein
LNPFFSTNLSPIRNSPQNNLFANSHGKIFNMLTRKFIALMTSGVTFLSRAGLDLILYYDFLSIHTGLPTPDPRAFLTSVLSACLFL